MKLMYTYIKDGKMENAFIEEVKDIFIYRDNPPETIHYFETIGEKMNEKTKKLSVDEIEHRIDALLGLFDTLVPDESRWYLAGLIDGYKIHHDRQVKE